MRAFGAPERGQASVEAVALAPIALVCFALALQALVAGANFVVAANAAHAAAIAGQLDRDPVKAARRSAVGWATSRIAVVSHGSRVRVRLTPRTIVPGLAHTLAVSADAGWTAR